MRPWFMTATVSAMVMASSWSCVTCRNVRPTSAWIDLSSSCIWRRSLRSRAPSGSSSSSSAGRLTIARASATRCCCPPESWLGRARRDVVQFDQPSASCALATASAHLAALQPERDVLDDGHVREQRIALEHRVDRALVRLRRGDILAADEDAARRRVAPDPRRAGGSSSCRSLTGPSSAKNEPAGIEEVKLLDRREAGERLADPLELQIRAGLGELSAAMTAQAPEPTASNSELYFCSSSGRGCGRCATFESVSSFGKISWFSTSSRRSRPSPPSHRRPG